MTIYYVYAYLRKSNSTPYYIGKGKDGRAYARSHSVSVPKDRQFIVFLERNLTEVGALALERRYIRWYGRKNSKDNPGVLRNKTDGGEGTSGKVITEAQKQKQRDLMTGKKMRLHTSEQNERKSTRQKGRPAWNRGIPQTVESNIKRSIALSGRVKSPMSEGQKSQISASLKGRKLTSVQNAKKSARMKGKPQPVITCPHCGKSGGYTMHRYHFDKCKLKN